MCKIICGAILVVAATFHPELSTDVNHFVVFGIGTLIFAFGLDDVSKNRKRK